MRKPTTNLPPASPFSSVTVSRSFQTGRRPSPQPGFAAGPRPSRTGPSLIRASTSPRQSQSRDILSAGPRTSVAFGPYTTCYNRFVRWRRAGVWGRADWIGELAMPKFSLRLVRPTSGPECLNCALNSDYQSSPMRKVTASKISSAVPSIFLRDHSWNALA